MAVNGEPAPVRLVREGGRWRLQAAVVPPAAGATPAPTPTPTPTPSNPPPSGSRAGDAANKSDVRAAVSIMESCYSQRQTYLGCDLNGVAPADRFALDVSAEGYVVAGRSESGAEFRIARTMDGETRRTCTAPAGATSCNDGTW